MLSSLPHWISSTTPITEEVLCDWVIPVYVKPNAKKSQVIGVHGDALKIALQALPVEGKANAELIRFLAKALALPKNRITLLRGETSRQKSISVSQVSAKYLQHCLLPKKKGE